MSQSAIMRSQASFTSLSASAAFAFICSHFASKTEECEWQIIQPWNLKMELITEERRKASKADKETKITKILSLCFYFGLTFTTSVDGNKKTIELHALVTAPSLQKYQAFGLCIIIRLARCLASGFQSSEGLGWQKKKGKKAKLYWLLTTPKHNNTRYTLNVEDEKELFVQPDHIS